MDKRKRLSIETVLDERYLPIDKSVLKEFVELKSKTDVAKPQEEDVRALRALVESTPDLWRAMGDLPSSFIPHTFSLPLHAC